MRSMRSQIWSSADRDLPSTYTPIVQASLKGHVAAPDGGTNRNAASRTARVVQLGGAGLMTRPHASRSRPGSGLDLGEDLAQWPGRWRIQIRAGRRLQPLLEPAIELALGGSELFERLGEVLPSEVGDEEVPCGVSWMAHTSLVTPTLSPHAAKSCLRGPSISCRKARATAVLPGRIGKAKSVWSIGCPPSRLPSDLPSPPLSPLPPLAFTPLPPSPPPPPPLLSGRPSPVSVACLYPRTRRTA